MFFITIPVLLFQLFIFITIIMSAWMSRGWFKASIIFWLAFTLFGSIYTFGLLLFQLFTIIFSYYMGERILRKQAVRELNNIKLNQSEQMVGQDKNK
jgi:hypothetical protein